MANRQLSDLAPAFAELPRAFRLVIPVALGALAATGHEDWRVGGIVLCAAFVISFLIVPEARRSAGWFGWLLGLGYFGVTLRWIVEPFLVDVPRHGWMAPFGIVLLAGGLALFWALAAWAARRIAGKGSSVALWMPLTLTAAEMLRGHVFTGFPWGMPSYALIGGPADIWFAWVGPYGTSGLVVGLAGLVAFCLLDRRKWLWGTIAVVPVATVFLQAISSVTMPWTDQTVRLIQPNAPQHQKWDPDWMGVFFSRALDLTRAGDPVDVVIWPETSVPAVLDYAQPWLEQMSLAARGAPVVAGIQRRDEAGYYNSAILLEGPSTVAAISDKAHLVPFGEYIPLAWLLEPMGLGVIVDQVAGFIPGEGTGLMEVEGLGLARVLICYEGIFPEEIQRGEARADVVLILTNDAWFGNNAGPRQHLVQARARAIEQGLPVIRAANTGISAVIDARGTVTAALGLNEAGHLDAAVPAPLPPTAYARIGDWPLVAILVLCLGIGGVRSIRFDVDGTERQV